ncbi:uncharacterized protein LOC128160742 [Crassostrea angulata]|uniref:uncharacterized protein LOC128160742 n=1 Tax=Magallana angulata TaxID=2784310 RepID=UPI0022B1592E|nr:uncharacterized protein LOC128160742 [Crassostrea angulata]
MYSTSLFQFTTAIPLLLTFYTYFFNKRALAESISRCLTNYYKENGDCKECPLGYFGDNCTNICPSSYYGRLCFHKCKCLPCHHIYECVSTTLKRIAETTSYSYDTKDETTDTNQIHVPETTSYEYKNEDKTKCSKQTPENVIISDTVLIISVGSLLCFMLILVIIREVCLCCRFPQPVGRKTIREAV